MKLTFYCFSQLCSDRIIAVFLLYHNCDTDSRWLQMYNTFRKNHTVCRIVFYSREVKGYLLPEVVKEE